MKDLNVKIQTYLDVKKKFAASKKLEASLRIELLELIFPEQEIGTNNFNYGDFVIKGKFSNTISLDKKKLEELFPFMSEEEQECIEFKPSLLNKVYADTKETPSLDECITIKPAMPTLDIKVIDNEY